MMVIVVLFSFFHLYVLPMLAVVFWINCYTKIVNDCKQSYEERYFLKSLKAAFGECYAFYVVSCIYLVLLCTLSRDIDTMFELLFVAKRFAPLGPPGYFVIGCFLIGLVYSYVFYKRHSK